MSNGNGAEQPTQPTSTPAQIQKLMMRHEQSNNPTHREIATDLKTAFALESAGAFSDVFEARYPNMDPELRDLLRLILCANSASVGRLAAQVQSLLRAEFGR